MEADSGSRRAAAVAALRQELLAVEAGSPGLSVLLCEFDIDVGGVLKLEYPDPIECAERGWLAELCLPEGSHNQSEDGCCLVLRRPAGLLFGLNVMRNKRDRSVKRGAIVKSCCVLAEHRWVAAFKPLIQDALEALLAGAPELTTAQTLHHTISRIALPSPRPLVQLLSTHMARALWSYRTRHFSSASPPGPPDPSVSVALPEAGRGPHTVSFGSELAMEGRLRPQAAVLELARCFGERLVMILNAVLMEKRVLVQGESAAQAERLALSVCAMVSPPLTGMLARVHTHCTLGDLGFLETAGFVAGCVNPMFKERADWWDLCVDASSGLVHVSGVEEPDDSNGWYYQAVGKQQLQRDRQFAVELVEQLDDGTCSELWVQASLQARTQQLLGLASAHTELDPDHGSLPVIIKRSAHFCQRGTRYFDLEIQMHSQRVAGGSASPDELVESFGYLAAACRAESDVPNVLLQMLSALPMTAGGVEALMVHLFHRSHEVQRAALELSQALEESEMGRFCMETVGIHFMMARARVIKRAVPLSD